jgi:hypothetical protein
MGVADKLASVNIAWEEPIDDKLVGHVHGPDGSVRGGIDLEIDYDAGRYILRIAAGGYSLTTRVRTYSHGRVVAERILEALAWL